MRILQETGEKTEEPQVLSLSADVCIKVGYPLPEGEVSGNVG